MLDHDLFEAMGSTGYREELKMNRLPAYVVSCLSASLLTTSKDSKLHHARQWSMVAE
jgi:hypothetical protein